MEGLVIWGLAVNRSNLEKDNYYSQGDIIGKQGVELSYEKYLRGEKGIKFIQKDMQVLI